MANEDGVRIPIVVESTGDLGKAAATGLQNVSVATEAAAASARKATEADRAYNAQLTESAGKAISGGEEVNAVEERRNGILIARRAILETEMELLQAERAGDATRAARLEEELAVQRESVALMRSTTLSEEEAVTLAQERVTLQREIATAREAEAVAARATAAADAESGAMTGASFAARRGVGGLLGIGSRGLAGGLPQMAAFIAVAEGFRMIREEMKENEKQAKETAKAMEEAAKATAARLKAIGDAEKQSLNEAKAEADALIKSLDEMSKNADKARSAMDKMTEAKAERDLAVIDQKEAEDMRAAKDDVARAQIKADAERARAGVHASAGSEKVVREQQSAEEELRGATGTRDQTELAEAHAAAQKLLAGDALDAAKTQAREASEARIKADAEQKAALAAYGKSMGKPSNEAARAALGEADAKAKAAKDHEVAAKLAVDDAEVKASDTASQAAKLAAALDDLNKKIAEATQKLEIAKIHADAQAIKSGTATAEADKKGADQVNAAKEAAAKKVAEEKERQDKATEEGRKKEDEERRLRIEAAEEAKRSGAGLPPGARGRGHGGGGVAGGHGGRDGGWDTIFHGGGAHSDIHGGDGVHGGSMAHDDATFRAFFTPHKKPAELPDTPVESIISSARAAMQKGSGNSANAELIKVIAELIDHIRADKGTNKAEIDQLKKVMRDLAGQIKGGRQ